jgi:hypothetical protein
MCLNLKKGAGNPCPIRNTTEKRNWPDTFSIPQPRIYNEKFSRLLEIGFLEVPLNDFDQQFLSIHQIHLLIYTLFPRGVPTISRQWFRIKCFQSHSERQKSRIFAITSSSISISLNTRQWGQSKYNSSRYWHF